MLPGCCVLLHNGRHNLHAANARAALTGFEGDGDFLLHGNAVKFTHNGAPTFACLLTNIKVLQYKLAVDRNVEHTLAYGQLFQLGKVQPHGILTSEAPLGVASPHQPVGGEKGAGNVSHEKGKQ